jgi:hypothetical protein
VRVVLGREFTEPYPEDIIDRVCLAIEADPNWLRQYETLVRDFSRRSHYGRDIANNSIGYWTKKEVGMETVKKGVQARSSLIKSYAVGLSALRSCFRSILHHWQRYSSFPHDTTGQSNPGRNRRPAATISPRRPRRLR